MPRLICVTGPDGSGKSTVIRGLLAKYRQELRITALEVSVWDLLKDRDRPSPMRPDQVEPYLSSLHSTGRAYFLLHCLREALDRASEKNPEVILLNAYWYKYLAAEVAYGGGVSELVAMAAGFPKPERTLYLDLPLTVAADRKQRFSGYETGFAKEPSRKAFEDLQTRLRPTLERWRQEWGWLSIDATQPPDAVLERCWRTLS